MRYYQIYEWNEQHEHVGACDIQVGHGSMSICRRTPSYLTNSSKMRSLRIGRLSDSSTALETRYQALLVTAYFIYFNLMHCVRTDLDTSYIFDTASLVCQAGIPLYASHIVVMCRTPTILQPS